MEDDLINTVIESKYKIFIDFCIQNDRMPKYNANSKTERKLRLFYVNKKNLMIRGDKGLSKALPEWEKEYISKMEEFKETIEDKLNIVLVFCKKYKKVPSYSYKSKYTKIEKIESDVYKKFNAVKNHQKKHELTNKEKDILDEILSYRNERQLPRIEKIRNVLAFCEEHNTTPKQHVKYKKEKKIAEFLSSIKTLERKKKLTKLELSILKKIKKYAPISKSKVKQTNLSNLNNFIETNKKLPKNKKGTPKKERKLATFYVKFNWLGKHKKLAEAEAKMLSNIHKVCNVKTRYEKIEELYAFSTEHNRVPTLKTKDNHEIKLAVFFNNLKNANKNKRLTTEESNLLSKILSIHKKISDNKFKAII